MSITVDGLVQDCINSIAVSLELPQSCIKPLMYIDIYNAFLIFTLQVITMEFTRVKVVKDFSNGLFKTRSLSCVIEMASVK